LSDTSNFIEVGVVDSIVSFLIFISLLREVSMAKKRNSKIYTETTPIFSIRNLEIPYLLLGNISRLKYETAPSSEGSIPGGFESESPDQTVQERVIARLKNTGDYSYSQNGVLRMPFSNIGFSVARTADIYSACLNVWSSVEDIFENVHKRLKLNSDFKDLGYKVDSDGDDICIYDDQGIAYVLMSSHEELTEIMMGSGGGYSRTFPEYDNDSPDAGEKSFENEIRGLEKLGNIIISCGYQGYAQRFREDRKSKTNPKGLRGRPFKKPVCLVPV